MIRRLLSAALLTLALSTGAAARPAIWTVRDADSTIVLFGALHLLPAGEDWRPAALDAALARADDLWFELPLDPAAQALAGQLALERGMASPGAPPLSSTLTPADRRRWSRAVARYHLDGAMLDRMKPWLAATAFSLAALQTEGASASEGVEHRLELLADPRAARRAFETPQEQIALFDDANPREQSAALHDTLRELDKPDSGFKALLKAWMAGDVGTLRRLGVEPLRKASPSFYRRMLPDRNRRWAQIIAERMAGQGVTVIVVGAGHLVGPEGVPALLRARGFSVEGP